MRICMLCLCCLLWSVPALGAGEPLGSQTPGVAATQEMTDALAAYAVGDIRRARDLWHAAAAKGNHDAQYRLGLLYEQGEGVEKSERDAAAWYGMAATGQNPDAQARLGRMYRDGRGVQQNATRATLLLYGAAMEGHNQAMQDLAALAPAGRSEPRLFGININGAKRRVMRETLRKIKVPVMRQDDGFICDVYNVEKAIPGATVLAACYGPAGNNTVGDQPLGFVKIDYPAPDAAQADRINGMVQGRFGAPAAVENSQTGMAASLWNLGSVVVATQYAPQARQSALMYMVPKVYHLTKQHQGAHGGMSGIGGKGIGNTP